MRNLSYGQQLALAVTPKVTSALSIPCSLFIIYEAWCDYRQGRSNAIQRSVVGMSVVDVLASSGWFLSTWFVPAGTFALSAGNQATCNVQGFLLQLAIGAPLYNCSLALYYLLVIKFNWSNEMLRRVEIWTHVAILSFSIGTSIALLPLHQYNHIGAVCWVIGSPAECGNSSYQPSDVPCDRGDWAWIYGLALFYGPLWVCILACITSMVVIYAEVRKTHRRLRRYSVSPGRGNHSLRRSATDTSLVATQAILYSLSFFITWTPSTAWSIAHWFNVKHFWLDMASAFCEPLQGFWNCLIFLRRRPSSQEKIRVAVNTIFPCFCKERRDNRRSFRPAISGHCVSSPQNRTSHDFPSQSKDSFRVSFKSCEGENLDPVDAATYYEYGPQEPAAASEPMDEECQAEAVVPDSISANGTCRSSSDSPHTGEAKSLETGKIDADPPRSDAPSTETMKSSMTGGSDCDEDEVLVSHEQQVCMPQNDGTNDLIVQVSSVPSVTATGNGGDVLDQTNASSGHDNLDEVTTDQIDLHIRTTKDADGLKVQANRPN